MTDDEIVTLRAAILLLENGTSNSLDPVYRQGWNDARETTIQRLRDMMR